MREDTEARNPAEIISDITYARENEKWRDFWLAQVELKQVNGQPSFSPDDIEKTKEWLIGQPDARAFENLFIKINDALIELKEPSLDKEVIKRKRKERMSMDQSGARPNAPLEMAKPTGSETKSEIRTKRIVELTAKKNIEHLKSAEQAELEKLKNDEETELGADSL